MLDIQVCQKCYQASWKLGLLEMDSATIALALNLIYEDL